MNKKANKYKMRDVPVTFFFSDFYHRRFHCELLAATFYATKNMVSEMVQNSQSLYSFTFTAVIVIHEYIYSHSTTSLHSRNIFVYI